MLNAIILGIIQSLTEFLPISSNAHLRLVGFCSTVRIRVPRTDSDAKMGSFIILGSVPIVVLGLIFQKTIETTLRSPWIIAVSLIVFGILLGIADYVGAKKRRLRNLTVTDAAICGGAQALALIPDVSRSGGTITAGLFLGYERAAAARYSFLLAIPAVFGSGLFELYKTIKSPGAEVFTGGETAVATVVSFVVGLGVIVFFRNYISKRSFLPFVIYRLALGGTLAVLLATGALRSA